MVRIATFRKFTHPELEKIGVPGGKADEAFLAKVVSNTNQLIRDKKHTPPVIETHRGSSDGYARGWVESASTDMQTFFSDINFTPTGQKRITDRDLRYVSSSFKRNFMLTGEPSGERLPGPYLDHVAMLGAENPAVKGLTDLSEIQFSEGDGDGSSRSWIVYDSAKDEVTFFSELPDGEPEDHMAGENNEARFAAIEAQLTTQKATITQLETEKAAIEAKFTEAQTHRTAAEAKLKEVTDAAAAAKFSEYQTKVGERVKKAQEEKKLGAEKAAALIARAKTVYGDPDKEALFAELLDNLAPVVPIKRLGEGDAGGEDGAGEYGASSADFAEMKKVHKDPAAVSRVNAATIAYMADKEEESYVKAQSAVERLASKHAAN